MRDRSELDPEMQQPTSRRQLLRLAGVAGAAGAAAVVLGSAEPANAANGDTMYVGTVMQGTNATVLQSTTAAIPAFSAENAVSGSPGLRAIGTDYVDVKLMGTGRLGQAPNAGAVGNRAPNFAAVSVLHEIVRSDTGVIWASQGSVAGSSNNKWKRVNAVRLDSASGDGTPFVPTRLIDTRHVTGGLIAAGGSKSVTVAGSANVPSDAVAVFGNLTAVAPTAAGYPAGGYLTVYPEGAARPTASNINVSATGQTAFPNFFFCPLGTNGGLTVYVAGTPSYFLIDIAGYVQ